MPSHLLTCAACGAAATESCGVVQDCSCGCRKMVYRPAMNMTERARRAETLAERLAAALEAEMDPPTEQRERTAAFAESIEAANAWTAYRADLDCLELREDQQ